MACLAFFPPMIIFCPSRACGWSSLGFSLQWWWNSGSGQAQALLLGHSEHVLLCTLMKMHHLPSIVWLQCASSITQDAVATYKETRNGLMGVDYSTKFSPWWAIAPVWEQGWSFHVNKSYKDISDGVILQAGAGLHFTQVHLSSEQAIWERANSQSEHILVGLVSEGLTVTVLISPATHIYLFFWIIRVIFELLWRDYFKFVAAKYGNKLFQVKGTISSSFVRQRKCV